MTFWTLRLVSTALALALTGLPGAAFACALSCAHPQSAHEGASSHQRSGHHVHVAATHESLPLVTMRLRSNAACGDCCTTAARPAPMTTGRVDTTIAAASTTVTTPASFVRQVASIVVIPRRGPPPGLALPDRSSLPLRI